MVFIVLREIWWEVVVRFVDIGGIVDHHWLEEILCFVDIGGIVDHHWLEEILCFVDIGGIVDHHWLENKGNNKITELRTILQRESQNS